MNEEKNITANELLHRFQEALKMEDQTEEQDTDLNLVILDILKYLDYKESGGDADPNASVRQYQNDKLWTEIMEKSLPSPHDCNTISLVQLRIILEKYKILGDEKDGM